MFMNKHAKGARVENIAKKRLVAEGFIVDKKNWSRFASKDIFGLWDLIAVKDNGSRLMLIQVKSNESDFYTARKQIKEWQPLENLVYLGIECELWLWQGKDIFRIERF